MKYWMPFQSDHGDIWVEGPYNTRDEALQARESAKRHVLPPSKYGIPFPAASREDAEKNAKPYV